MRALVFSIVVAVSACSTLPRDPEGTLERARRGSIRVGLIENPPWVVRTPGEPAGAEVELIRRFASRIGARPQWFWGGEQQHMHALQRFSLDLVAGGLDDRDPWAKMVGVTRPYFEDRVLVGVKPPASEPPRISDLTIAAEAGGEVAGRLEQKHVRVQPVSDPNPTAPALAAPDWRLERLGYAATRFDLLKRAHVIATPPGENAWLKALGDFLDEQRSEIRPLLQREDSRR